MPETRFGLRRPEGLNLSAVHTSFPYQLDALEAVRDLDYAALFHEQGLGKTKIAIDLGLDWLRSDTVDTVCFVTKNALVANWVREIGVHAHLVPSVISRDKRENFYVFNSAARFLVMHYETARTEFKRLKLFLKTRRVGVILDESQKIKNPVSKLTQSFFDLRSLFVRRVIMTGTPVANRPEDIWSQIYFLDAGKALGDDFETFKSSMDLSNDLWRDEQKQGALEKRLASIFSEIQWFTVRETKSSAGIDLPSKRVENIPVELEAEQRRLYDDFRFQMGAEILKDGAVIADDAEAVLKRLLRLVQIASNPGLVDEGYKKTPGKLEALEKLLSDRVGTENKAIVWTNFVDNANWLASKLKAQCGVAKVHGKMSIDDRNLNIDRFKSDSSCRILVATPGAAKEGLTLTVASHAIFFDRSFSLDDYLQAQDRIHRISQEKTCFVWNLIGKESIDEWIDKLLLAKRSAAELVLSDIDRKEYRDQMPYEFGKLIAEILDPGLSEGK